MKKNPDYLLRWCSIIFAGLGWFFGSFQHPRDYVHATYYIASAILCALWAREMTNDDLSNKG